jgi:transcriptional regulator with XRE-family HTH domain
VRLAFGLSQRQFAARLGVSLESYRPWDAGRRETPEDVIRRALALVAGADVDAPIPLAALSRIRRINKGTLRAAARDGRLRVTTAALTESSRPILRATRSAGEDFKARFYQRTTRLTEKPPAPDLFCSAPDDFDRQLVALRGRVENRSRRVGGAYRYRREGGHLPVGVTQTAALADPVESCGPHCPLVSRSPENR